jgi:hypothetical protein
MATGYLNNSPVLLRCIRAEVRDYAAGTICVGSIFGDDPSSPCSRQ